MTDSIPPTQATPPGHADPTTGPGPNRAFVAVLDAVPGSWFFARQDGSFAYVNLGACKALGYTREQLLAARIFDIDPTMKPELWARMWTGTRPTDTMTLKTSHRRSCGTVFPVEVRASRLFVDGEDLAVSYSVDLTSSEATRQALEKTEAELERLLNHLPDLVFRLRCRPTVDWLFVSPSCAHLLGYQPEDLLRGGVDLGRLVHPHDIDSFLALDREKAGRSHKIRFLHRDGHIVWMGVRATAFEGTESGELVLEGVARDVTDQLKLEAQLIQAQKMEAVGQLAGGIAHDFNNLLFIVQGNIRLMKRNAPTEKFAHRLGDAESALEQASSLVKQLLTFSRKGNVETSTLELQKILTGSHAMLSRLLGEHIRLEFECAVPDPLLVVGNAPQLEQVIVNLCVNARDAMPDGGSLRVTLERITRDQLPEPPVLAEDAGFARITVSDTGHGMPADVRERVFEPFFTTKAPGKGTGLGLATAYAIVKQHHGQLEVESHPGQGTTFSIHLPLSDGELPAPRSWGAPLDLDGGNRWVLLAEDEPGVRLLLAEYLEQIGFQVVSVCNGRAAIAALDERGQDFALVVMDAVMPELGGRSVLQELRGRGLDTPVLFVTGYDNESLADVHHSPNVAVLAKPFEPEKLTHHAAKLLRGARRPGEKPA